MNNILLCMIQVCVYMYMYLLLWFSAFLYNIMFESPNVRLSPST